MKKNKQQINKFLVGVFNEILKIEEDFIVKTFADLSVKEVHVIEAVCNADEKGDDNRSTSIAEKLKVTAGTLTTAVAQLERKGYLLRERDENDKRIVHIVPTEKGFEAQKCHVDFHEKLVDNAVSNLSDEELEIFVKALNSIATFFINS